MNLFPEQGNYCRYSASGWAPDSQQDLSGLRMRSSPNCQSVDLLHHRNFCFLTSWWICSFWNSEYKLISTNYPSLFPFGPPFSSFFISMGTCVSSEGHEPLEGAPGVWKKLVSVFIHPHLDFDHHTHTPTHRLSTVYEHSPVGKYQWL